MNKLIELHFAEDSTFNQPLLADSLPMLIFGRRYNLNQPLELMGNHCSLTVLKR